MLADIPITEFERRFYREYAFIYDAFDRVAGYRHAVSEFDRMMKTDESFRHFVSEFAKYRSDPITSDREAAAFMYVLFDMADDESSSGPIQERSDSQ